MNTRELVDAIAGLPMDWHGAGTVGRNVLDAIVTHVGRRGPIERSIETGSGKTTLLLSHLSPHHTVFAVDAGQSISRVRGSDLFNVRSTTFVEGPTQRTLPRHYFAGQHQFALIDGPHGYPFPDLEYFFLYPTIATSGLLVLDDLLIPTIGRMFDVIKQEAMFELLEVVDDNTAFFKRTSAPAIDPDSDSWWLQGYNQPYYDKIVPPSTRTVG